MLHLLRHIPMIFSARGLTAFNSLGTRVQLPIVCFIAYIGYTIEGWISKRYTPSTKPIKEQRQDRLLEEFVNTEISNDKPKKHEPLLFNLSPSLPK